MKEILEILKHAFYREKGDMPLIHVTATEIHALKSDGIDLRKELKAYSDDLGINMSWSYIDKWITSRPDSKAVTDEMIEKWARDKAQETGYDVTGIRAKMISIGAKALRDNKIK